MMVELRTKKNGRKESIMEYIIRNIYTNPSPKWIQELENNEIKPVVVQRWLVMNDRIRIQIRWLDKYVFALQKIPKMYLSLAWSLIPKVNSPPFCPYIGKDDETDEFNFIFKKIRKHYKMADNDFRAIKERLRKSIESDMIHWFAYYGIEKKYWRKYYLDFDILKTMGKEQKAQSIGLDKWGM